MEIKYSIKVWITNTAADLEAIEFKAFASSTIGKESWLNLLAVQQQQQKEETRRSYSTGNTGDDLWKVKLLAFISEGTGI